MKISASNIYQWRDSGRPIDLAKDLELLWDDSSCLNSLVLTRAYADYIISQFQHEDYERDATWHLVSHDGPYADLIPTICQEMEGVTDSEAEPSFDSLAMYFLDDNKEINGEWISTGKPRYVSEDLLKDFFFRYVSALFQNPSFGDEIEDVPEDLLQNFSKIIKAKIDDALISLAE